MFGLHGEFGPVEPSVEVSDDSRWWAERLGSFNPMSFAHHGRLGCIISVSWPGGKSVIRSIDDPIFLGTAKEDVGWVGFVAEAWGPWPADVVTEYNPVAGENELGDEVG